MVIKWLIEGLNTLDGEILKVASKNWCTTMLEREVLKLEVIDMMNSVARGRSLGYPSKSLTSKKFMKERTNMHECA